MDEMQQFMHNVFWHEDQVVVRFQLGGSVPQADVQKSGDNPIFIRKVDAIKFLNLDGLSRFLAGQGFKLSSFNVEDTLRAPGVAGNPPLDSPIGKYLFRTRDAEGNIVPTVIGFLRFEPIGAANQPPRPPFIIMPMSDMSMPNKPMSGMSMSGMHHDGDDNDHDDDDHGKGHHHPVTKSLVPHVVNLLNARANELRKGLDDLGSIPIVAASPHWLAGSTTSISPDGAKPVACPAIPAMPVKGDDYCTDSPGLWPISLPSLPHALQSMTGNGTTVFVLDTLPKHGDITRALEGAEDNNMLLQDVASNVSFQYNLLPDVLDHVGPYQPSTGKDIYGRLIGGFHLQDHGLFISGIIRDIAPDATVECIRMLSDYGIGDLATLTKALEEIHDRMSPFDPNTSAVGDLYQQPVVINMSLVISPVSDQQAADLGYDPKLVHSTLLGSLQSLVGLGAIIVASAGNEADTRPGSKAINPGNMRPGALFPAAFANAPYTVPGIIPVGAVDKHGNPASYSCYPGTKGIATYGGEVPTPVAPVPPACMTGASNIDGLIGIYSALDYPALSLDDCRSRYPIPNTNAWAYWVGTSFATPIISAVVARMLEMRLRGGLAANVDIPSNLINSVASQQVAWDRLNPSDSSSGSAQGPLIIAVQCQPQMPALG